ncbi:MAG: hypothetical protein IKI11_10240 [Neisseriaceae bacterium]|nr:hypothetical protein [Neisseriaceae bacterium]
MSSRRVGFPAHQQRRKALLLIIFRQPKLFSHHHFTPPYRAVGGLGSPPYGVSVFFQAA